MSMRPSVVSGPAEAAREFAADVEYYLTQQPRQLPSRYFYDALGSALFDAICRLPWYRVTRAELRLLTDRGGGIVHRVGPPSDNAEVGGGNGGKPIPPVEAGGPAGRPPLGAPPP